MGFEQGAKKVDRADEDPGRWKESLETIELIHGKEERLKMEALLVW
jgi:hypothetical protein